PVLADGAQVAFAAAGALSRHQAHPRAELRAALELLEVADGGDRGRGGDRADADELGGTSHVGVVASVLGDALGAPGDVLVELAPVLRRTLQRQPRQHRAVPYAAPRGLCGKTRPNSA